MRRALLLVLTIAIALPLPARTAAELQLALRKLAVTGSALYVAAHPDDENTALLAWLANERLYRTAYLSVTRGDGGQNLIGQETGALLGVIRTHELLQARKIDRAEQLFTRAIDFGFSKTPAETLAIWGEELVLADVVWAIRRFQPDVIITRFPTTGEGGHGHHTASAILAERAFTLAADPKAFPEQLNFVTPWQAKRIFFNRFSFGRPIDPNDPAVANSLRIDLGAYNRQLGRAYTEIAAESRSQHKSQGFGSAERRGTLLNYFDLKAGEPAAKDLFEGVETSWSRYPKGEQLGALLKEAADKFDPDNPQASVPLLIKAHALLDGQLSAEWPGKTMPWLETKKRELLEAIRDCAGIAIDVSAADSTITPGAELPVSVTVVNRSDYPFRLSMVASLHANPSLAPGTLLENNKPVKTDIKIKLPATFALTQPYWLQHQPNKGLFNVPNQIHIGRPDNYTEIPINVVLADQTMNTLIFQMPLVYRWTDPVKGEQVREVDVVPPATVKLGSNVYIFPDAKPRQVTMWMKSFGATSGIARLNLPGGWQVAPVSREVKFSGKGDEQRVTFTVTPPATEDTNVLTAQLLIDENNVVTQGIVDIDYAHIPAQRILGDAAVKLVRADIKRSGQRIGYIMGSGDDVPNILRQVGFDVELLTDADLDRGDFAKYDAIVAGIRAYNTRDRLKLAHEKLMQYVENGGTMVVQYNTSNFLGDTNVAVPGPYPFKISRDRVTVEEAPVKLLDPAHPLFTAPNKITAKDFEGWVQERGLYFLTDWDPKYSTMLSTNDPGEPEKPGGQLYAKHGKGAFIYTGYAWWRQLPAGVPGAIRAFVNLVSQ
jgi:LmbE family N-acetylglucosaminyl deacetylase